MPEVIYPRHISMTTEWEQTEDDPFRELREKLDRMQFDFTGQRADKFAVRLRRDGVEIDYYTVMCEECGGEGYYNQRGEIVCEECGLVLSGDEDPAVFKDYSGSRGFSDQQDDVYYRSQMGPKGVTT